MNFNFVSKAKHFFYYFAIILLPVLLITNNYLNQKKQYIQKLLAEEKAVYEVILDFNMETANIFFTSVINQPAVLDIMSRAQNQNEDFRADLRNKLFNLLINEYNRIKERGVRQLHFHLPDCESFLRFYKPDLFGDNLKGYRYSVEKVNADLIPISGFEEGRVFNGFRNVFPLVVEGEHLGSVEISMSNRSFTDRMNRVDSYKHIFALKKETIQRKLPKSEYDNYHPSDFSDDYLFESSYNPDDLAHSLFGTLRFKIDKKLREGLPFAVEARSSGETYLIAFHPILNVAGDQVAYLISYESDKTIHEFYIAWLVSIVITALLLLTIYVLSLKYLRKLKSLAKAQESISASQEQQKHIEQELIKSEEKYRLIVESANDGIEITQDDRIIFSNLRFAEMLGYTVDEMLNLSFTKIFTANGIRKLKERQRRREAKQSEIKSYETTFLKKDGGKINVDVKYEIIDYQGKPATFAIIRDITKHKQAAEALKTSEEKFSKLFHSNPALVGLSDLDTDKFIEVNQAFCDKLGFKPEEVIGKRASEVVRMDFQSRERAIAKLKTDNFVKNEEAVIYTKEGIPVDVLIFVEIIEIQGKKVNFTTAVDITDRKRAELERKLALEEARKASEVKDQFIANISHEIRTPLNSILGFSDLLKQKYGTILEEKDRRIFGFIANASQRLMRTVDSILNISQLSAGTLKIYPKKTDLATLTRRVAEDLKKIAQEKGLELNLSIPDQPENVSIDEQSIYQVLYSLIENAIKFTKQGAVNLKLMRHMNEVVLTIQDTGIGISEAYQKRMFEPYTQESEGFTKNFQGIGLGLSVAHKFLELNQVELQYESKQDVGTTFTLSFKSYEEPANA